MITALDKRTALILIDLQKGITAMPAAHPATAIVANASALLQAFHTAGLPAFIVNVDPFIGNMGNFRTSQQNIPSDAEARKTVRAAMAEKGFFDIVPELPVDENDTYITKTDWNAFTNPELNKQLQAKGITGIVLAGIATSIGVEGTARAAHDQGYNLSFASDAMTDLHATAHEHSLTLIFPRLGEVDTTKAIIEHLAKR